LRTYRVASSDPIALSARLAVDLRHTCLSLLLALGTPPHIAQAIAGHAHVDVTMSIYAHTAMDDQATALGKLGDALGQVG
jgi:integrase